MSLVMMTAEVPIPLSYFYEDIYIDILDLYIWAVNSNVRLFIVSLVCVVFLRLQRTMNRSSIHVDLRSREIFRGRSKI